MARVLIVDDEEDIRESMGRFLAKEGHEVLSAADARDAVPMLDGVHFDVVVSDIIMPRTSGVELLKTIKELSPFTKVIMVTGEPNLKTSATALRYGAFDYLSKPVNRNELCTTVARAVAFKVLEDKERTYHDRLKTEVRERTEKLRRVLEQTANALGAAMAMRDSYTAGHQRRVTRIAYAIATELGLPDEQKEGLRVAGLLHDIGKLNIPAEILSKPGRINNAELSLVRNHVQAGYDILEAIEFQWPVAQMVLQHHERMDGSGYPNGLKGEDILIEARILAVSDVVEAMASHRPYRPAQGIDKALEEIEQNKGTLYDAKVADACIAVCCRDKWCEGEFVQEFASS